MAHLESFTWTLFEVAVLSFSKVSSPAITAVNMTKVLPSAASFHHVSAGLATIAVLCGHFPVPVPGAQPTGGRAGRPAIVRQDTVHWGRRRVIKSAASKLLLLFTWAWMSVACSGLSIVSRTSTTTDMKTIGENGAELPIPLWQ